LRKFGAAASSVERLLVGVIVLPSLEVADVAFSPNVTGPSGMALHHGVVQANGK
jgi:hypothetical protein